MTKLYSVLGTTLLMALAACASSPDESERADDALILPAKLGESCGDGIHVLRPCALGLVCVHEQVFGEPGSFCEEAEESEPGVPRP